jgi:hypothetical protein
MIKRLSFFLGLAILFAAFGFHGFISKADAQTYPNPRFNTLLSNGGFCPTSANGVYSGYTFNNYLGNSGWEFVAFIGWDYNAGYWIGEWAEYPVWMWPGAPPFYPYSMSPAGFFTLSNNQADRIAWYGTFLYWPPGIPGSYIPSGNPCQYDDDAPYGPPTTFYYYGAANTSAAQHTVSNSTVHPPALTASDYPRGYTSHKPGVPFKWNANVDGPLPQGLVAPSSNSGK